MSRLACSVKLIRRNSENRFLFNPQIEGTSQLHLCDSLLHRRKFQYLTKKTMVSKRFSEWSHAYCDMYFKSLPFMMVVKLVKICPSWCDYQHLVTLTVTNLKYFENTWWKAIAKISKTYSASCKKTRFYILYLPHNTSWGHKNVFPPSPMYAFWESMPLLLWRISMCHRKTHQQAIK